MTTTVSRGFELAKEVRQLQGVDMYCSHPNTTGYNISL